MNGINKYVTETSEIPIASVQNGCTVKPVAKAKPRPKPTFTLTPVSILHHKRKWIDADPGKSSQGCFEVSKFMIRLLRHDESVLREEDGAVRCDDLAEKFKAKFDGGPKKSVQYFLNLNSSEHFLYFRAIQGHSGAALVDPTLQDNVLLPDDFAEYVYHIGNAHDMHSIVQGGLIPGGKSQEGQAVSVFHSGELRVRQSRSRRS